MQTIGYNTGYRGVSPPPATLTDNESDFAMADPILRKYCEIANQALIDCKLIPLTQGQITIVDIGDYDHLTQWSWYAMLCGSDKYYAKRSVWVNMLCRKHLRSTYLKMVGSHEQF